VLCLLVVLIRRADWLLRIDFAVGFAIWTGWLGFRGINLFLLLSSGHLDSVQNFKVLLLLPLSEYEVVFFEILSHQRCVLSFLENRATCLITLIRLHVEVPPPATAFKQLHDQRCVVAPTNEALVVDEARPFELEFDVILFVERVKKELEHLLFRVAEKGFRTQVIIFWDVDCHLLCQRVDKLHIDHRAVVRRAHQLSLNHVLRGTYDRRSKVTRCP